MCELKAGDLVREKECGYEMLAIGRADDEVWVPDSSPAFFCVWEEGHQLREEIFPAERLVLVRPERRKIPRRGELQIPRAHSGKRDPRETKVRHLRAREREVSPQRALASRGED